MAELGFLRVLRFPNTVTEAYIKSALIKFEGSRCTTKELTGFKALNYHLTETGVHSYLGYPLDRPGPKSHTLSMIFVTCSLFRIRNDVTNICSDASKATKHNDFILS